MPPHSAVHILPPQYQDGRFQPNTADRSQDSGISHNSAGVLVIDNLENAANQILTQPNATVPAPPPTSSSLTQPLSKKRKLIAQSDESALPQSVECLLKKTYNELVVCAQENSKGSMSQADRDFFLNFYEEQRQLLAIKAIERQISMPMVDAFLGKRLALKGPNCWNQFLKTPEARAIFKEAGGVDDDSAMKKVSELWHKLTPEEKKSFAKHVDDGLTDEERALDDDPSGELDLPVETDIPIASGQVGIRATSIRSEASFRQDYQHVQAFVNQVVENATHVAATYNAQFVVFAVSNHLGPSTYQISQCTPGARVFLQYAKDVDAEHHYAARFQSHITGYSVAQIADLANKVPKRGEAKTEGVIKKWHWTDTHEKLAKAGFRLVVAPSARINPNWITQPSRQLLVDQVGLLHLDLDDKQIDIVRVPWKQAGATDRSSPRSSLGSTPEGTPPPAHSINHQQGTDQ
ncbi:uncharacterized protein PGTG_02071 [Puccinia graminis f. sp. tritici CRL 75-36-700-3]|uniref:Uncharacterized protein n=1 Tax=Puccinia graminis f. sp. tritici (strain CRL 75-36-700-3 / race SCCL) TaxID=418459 RepID=E3JX35_PUCGT|nr:uncharacterized protein PGTG_02071 [Puccinia graminis f. sp. tritici CRL 75-36-700-3]EFP76610.2 hypothetical protein PGTG_02071 [Puccinia graminis f. sp. tritici CRL 75-36-700-3]